ncbi:MAG: translation initiation factor IF-2, partial [Candidatus Woesearchaeota archaeon]|nr:translation initiation factor IF-2 [Candidatus Woesearchaeota archaeon]
MSSKRSLICATLGHVDHGKSSILDKIRGTAIVNSEAGSITQAIGASIIPLEIIEKVCGELLKSLNMEFTIPGLLFIDTPGHEAFAHLRKRGGNLADIAVVVVDINDGFKPQSLEAIELLKASKTPFIIAANKIDLINGWNSAEGPLLTVVSKQSERVVTALDEKMYGLVGELSKLGFEAERFDRVHDFTKQISLVPVSALTGDGISELLMVISGLAQKFLEKGLRCNLKGAAKGSLFEVKDVKGIGKALDVIMYDGSLQVGDTIVIGGIDKPIVTKVKALFEPADLAEMRDTKAKFNSVKKVTAATGVRISANGIDSAISGMPFRSVKKESLDKVKKEIQSEVDEVVIESDGKGVVIKADSLGSLEALIYLLKEKNITIKKASVGNITKKDIAEAEANLESEPLQAAVLGFNVVADAKSSNVKIITHNVIYQIIDDFEKWQGTKRKSLEQDNLGSLIRPCKVEIMKGYIFRQSNPAVVGVNVEAGTLRNEISLMKKEGVELAQLKGIQLDQENIEKAERGKQVAISLQGVTVGRQIKEGDILYSFIPEEDFKQLKELKQYLNNEEKDILKEIAL